MRGSLSVMLALLDLLLLTSTTCADDWPEWRGVRRDGISRETGWLDGWPQGQPPAVAWRAEVGKGHSAISVSRGLAYTVGWDGEQDTVFCFDAITGKHIWKHSFPCESIKQWPGPRATPTVHAGRVYTLSQHGLLHAFAATTGKVIWKVQLPAEYNPDVDYGFAWSPLVEGEFLILACGQRGLAIRTKDGSYAWGHDMQAGACASPVRHDLNGKRIVVLVLNNQRESVALVGIDPASGKELWRSEAWPEKWGAACIDPVVSERAIFLTTAEQHKEGGRFSVDGTRLVHDWSNRKLACYTGSCVLVGGHLFGVTKAGVLKCVDWQSGRDQWDERGFDGHGALAAAGDKLLIQTSERGDLVIADTSPSRYEELRRFKVFAGEPTTFTAPVVANGRIYCRSYAGEIVCLETGKPSK